MNWDTARSMTEGNRTERLVSSVIVLGLVCLAILSASSSVAGDGSLSVAGSSAAALPDRPNTRGEVEREVIALLRAREELVARIGDKQPTESQSGTLDELTERIAALRSVLDTMQSEAEREARAAGNSFKGKWIRLREALQDFTRYDLKDGMFRVHMGARVQLDATFANEDDAVAAVVGQSSSSFDFRRARIFVKGRLVRAVDFSVAKRQRSVTLMPENEDRSTTTSLQPPRFPDHAGRPPIAESKVELMVRL